jgi:hypothetical protein
MLEAAMTSTDLLGATMTSSGVVKAILNIVDMVEVILSPTPEPVGPVGGHIDRLQTFWSMS